VQLDKIPNLPNAIKAHTGDIWGLCIKDNNIISAGGTQTIRL
jgi:hypothetical protein